MTEMDKMPFSFTTSSDIGILISHGYTSVPGSFRYIGEKLYGLGFNVECPLLTGHGSDWKTLNSVKYETWVADLETALEKLKSRSKIIFGCGLSLGGLLMLRLAMDHKEIQGLSLINHAIFFNNPLSKLAGILKYIVPQTPAIASDIKAPGIVEPAYDVTPTGGVDQINRLVKVVKKAMPGIKTPVIIFKSKNDHIVAVKSAPFTMDRIGSERKELIYLENSYHVATMDNDKDLIIEKSAEFFRSLAKGGK